MLGAQGAQLKLLEAKLEKYYYKSLNALNIVGCHWWDLCYFNRENKDLKTRQARVAVETAKEVASDKTLRNKAEKERRLREKNQNNTKKFIEERKITAMKQGKEKEKLMAMHAKQLEDLNRDIQLVTFHFFLAKCATRLHCLTVKIQKHSLSVSLNNIWKFVPLRVPLQWLESAWAFTFNLDDYLGVGCLLLTLKCHFTKSHCF